jgi:hypothetical protein
VRHLYLTATEYTLGPDKNGFLSALGAILSAEWETMQTISDVMQKYNIIAT